MKTLYRNARVYTGTLPLAECFAVEDGLFCYAGSLSGAPECDETVDLGGRFVCPGFNDSHMHVVNFGQALSIAPLHLHTGSLADMLACLRATLAAGSGLRGGWLLGRGWNQDYFSDGKRMPTRHDLDQVSTEVPICAVRACGHALTLNSRAIELLNIPSNPVQPDGGQILLEDGVPNGIFLDNAMEPVYDAIPAPDKEELKDMIRTACQALNGYGITSAHSDDYSTFANLPWQTVNEAYRKLEESGELTVRINQQSNFSTLSDLQAFVEAGNRTGAGTDRFRIGPLKMLGDGALGARTAYLSRPYGDDPTTCGIPVFSQETFDEMIGYANEQGMSVAVHAIGDACLDRVLSAMEKALAAHPRKDHRHGIVHCQITRPDQLEKMARMGLHIYAQSIFLDYDIRIVTPRAGEELASTSYSWKTLLKSGATVSNGSDCPVELPRVLPGIQCAVTRTCLDGSEPAYLPEEAFTVQEALDSFTSGGAFASFEENRKGYILPGMLADFVVLGEDPFRVPAEIIGSIPVVATYLGGQPVFTAQL